VGFFSVLKDWYNRGVYKIMDKRFPFIVSLVLILVISLLYWVGTYFQLHWRVAWYDYVLHIMSGFLIGFIVAEFIQHNTIFHARLIPILISGFIVALSIGLLWEGLELQVGLTSLISQGYTADTSGDLIADVFGGIIGAFYSYRRLSYKRLK
jgi:hypothetical protein